MKDQSTTPAFFQDGPELGNQFNGDGILTDFLTWQLPQAVLNEIQPGLVELGGRVSTDILQLARTAEAQPPELVHFDPWGRRIDEIKMCAAWQALEDVAASEGIVATAYEQKQGEFSRLHQFVRLYLFHPSSAMVSCPLAMTDGAAKVLQHFGEGESTNHAFVRLTSRDPGQFWTSGQWMTERSGGSDVSQSATVARFDGGCYYLYGTKWFTSATTSDMALALAKIENQSRLSLFYLQMRDHQGRLNKIEIHRLKDKLGTRAMSTAELSLNGTPVILIGEAGEGVKTVATMLNITRLYNAVCAMGSMRRGLALASDYAGKRRAFGKTLIEHPLHALTLAELEHEFEGGFHLVFYAGVLLGKLETGQASESEQLVLRLLTPLAKLYTGKQAVSVCSEVVECFGGAGYIEDTGIPKILRDAQVLPIWEGTTNVLSLDVLRVLENPTVIDAFVDDLRQRLSAVDDSVLAEQQKQIENSVQRLLNFLQSSATDAAAFESKARRLSFAMARLYICSLLLEHAWWSSRQQAQHSFERLSEALAYWIAKPLEV